MPDARVGYVHGTVINYAAYVRALNKVITDELHLNGRELDPATEIDIEFYERNPLDQAIAAVKVRVTAHGTRDRLSNPDTIARHIRNALEEVSTGETIDVGVRLPQVGYSSVAYDKTRATSGLIRVVFSSMNGPTLDPAS